MPDAMLRAVGAVESNIQISVLNTVGEQIKYMSCVCVCVCVRYISTNYKGQLQHTVRTYH